MESKEQIHFISTRISKMCPILVLVISIWIKNTNFDTKPILQILTVFHRKNVKNKH
jgi:hypothetical protein